MIDDCDRGCRIARVGHAAQLLLEDPVAAGRCEGVDLAVELLVAGRDPGVPDQRTCAADRFDRITVELELGEARDGSSCQDRTRKSLGQVVRHSAVAPSSIPSP